jgi:hypothetical protein
MMDIIKDIAVVAADGTLSAVIVFFIIKMGR